MILQGNGFILREWTENDKDELIAIANEEDVYINLRDAFPHPYTENDAVNWIDFARNEKNKGLFFAIEVDKKLAGSIGITLKTDIYRKNAEIGYFLSKKFRGKGIMTNAVKIIVKYIFDNKDIIRIYAEPMAKNIASRKVLENAGFSCEAILKNYIIKQDTILDSCIYSLLKENWNNKENENE
jgi:RimJ/RimL family protein N-acetyltransferase